MTQLAALAVAYAAAAVKDLRCASMNYANYKPVRFALDCLFAAAENVDKLVNAPSSRPLVCNPNRW